MAEGQIQLPDDAANAGPISRTVTQTIGGDSVHQRVEAIGSASNTNTAEIATADPLPTDAALVTRPINGSGTNALHIQDGGNSISVDGPLTDAELRAVPVPVSGTFFLNSGGTNVVAVGGTVTATLLAGTAAIGSLADKTTSGSLTAAAQTIQIETPGGMSTWSVEISGTWTGTIAFEVSEGGTVYSAVFSSAGVNSVTANGLSRGSATAVRYFRVRASAWTSGTADVLIRLTPGLFQLGLGGSGNSIGVVAQGASAVASLAWPVRVTDTTNFMPTMDAVGRAGFFKLTDGTNTAPTMDTVGRAGFQKLTDGTTTAAVDSSTAALRMVDYARAPTRVSGTSAAPSASAVIADTGQLAAGEYRIEYHLSAMDTLAVGKGMVVEHRNAANGATTNRLGGCVAGQSQDGFVARITLATNERVRVIAGTAAGAASSLYVAHVAAYPMG